MAPISSPVYTIWGMKAASDPSSKIHHNNASRFKAMISACSWALEKCGMQDAIYAWRKETWYQLHSRILIDIQGNWKNEHSKF